MRMQEFTVAVFNVCDSVVGKQPLSAQESRCFLEFVHFWVREGAWARIEGARGPTVVVCLALSRGD